MAFTWLQLEATCAENLGHSDLVLLGLLHLEEGPWLSDASFPATLQMVLTLQPSPADFSGWPHSFYLAC